jgi:hypothetical protein
VQWLTLFAFAVLSAPYKTQVDLVSILDWCYQSIATKYRGGIKLQAVYMQPSLRQSVDWLHVYNL